MCRSVARYFEPTGSPFDICASTIARRICIFLGVSLESSTAFASFLSYFSTLGDRVLIFVYIIYPFFTLLSRVFRRKIMNFLLIFIIRCLRVLKVGSFYLCMIDRAESDRCYPPPFASGGNPSAYTRACAKYNNEEISSCLVMSRGKRGSAAILLTERYIFSYTRL